MREHQLNTKILSKTDQSYFNKSLQSYFFFKQESNSPLSSSLTQKLSEGSNLVYSLILTYLKEEKFEINYLQEINELLKEIHKDSIQLSPNPLLIPATEIGDIVLNEQVPIEFNDEETNLRLQLLYNTHEGICLWSLI